MPGRLRCAELGRTFYPAEQPELERIRLVAEDDAGQSACTSASSSCPSGRPWSSRRSGSTQTPASFVIAVCRRSWNGRTFASIPAVRERSRGDSANRSSRVRLSCLQISEHDVPVSPIRRALLSAPAPPRACVRARSTGCRPPTWSRERAAHARAGRRPTTGARRARSGDAGQDEREEHRRARPRPRSRSPPWQPRRARGSASGCEAASAAPHGSPGSSRSAPHGSHCLKVSTNTLTSRLTVAGAYSASASRTNAVTSRGRIPPAASRTEERP